MLKIILSLLKYNSNTNLRRSSAREIRCMRQPKRPCNCVGYFYLDQGSILSSWKFVIICKSYLKVTKVKKKKLSKVLVSLWPKTLFQFCWHLGSIYSLCQKWVFTGPWLPGFSTRRSLWSSSSWSRSSQPGHGTSSSNPDSWRAWKTNWSTTSTFLLQSSYSSFLVCDNNFNVFNLKVILSLPFLYYSMFILLS